MLSPSIKQILCVKGCHLQWTRELFQAASSSGGECKRGRWASHASKYGIWTRNKKNGVVESEQAPESVVALVPELATTGLAPEPTPNNRKFGKNLTYSRREKAIPGSVHVQESNPTSLHKVTLSDPINSNDSNEFVSENRCSSGPKPRPSHCF